MCSIGEHLSGMCDGRISSSVAAIGNPTFLFWTLWEAAKIFFKNLCCHLHWAAVGQRMLQHSCPKTPSANVLAPWAKSTPAFQTFKNVLILSNFMKKSQFSGGGGWGGGEMPIKYFVWWFTPLDTPMNYLMLQQDTNLGNVGLTREPFLHAVIEPSLWHFIDVGPHQSPVVIFQTFWNQRALIDTLVAEDVVP